MVDAMKSWDEKLDMEEDMLFTLYDMEATKQVYLKYKKITIEQKLAKGVAHPRIQKLYDESQEFRQGKDVRFLWITINPDETKAQLGDLMNSVLKLRYKKFVVQMEVVYEQRGETEEDRGKGYHCHILLEFKDVRYDNVKRSIHTIFDKLCGTSLHVNVKPCYEKWLQDKKQYLRGNKWDEEKDDKIQQDKLWRQEFNIDPLYTYGAVELVEPHM